jgi:hypothetical protein
VTRQYHAQKSFLGRKSGVDRESMELPLPCSVNSLGWVFSAASYFEWQWNMVGGERLVGGEMVWRLDESSLRRDFACSAESFRGHKLSATVCLSERHVIVITWLHVPVQM